MPVGQSGATEPCWWIDKIVKVITPATDVTNVEARAAGATSAGRRPDPIRMGARIEPPPIPLSCWPRYRPATSASTYGLYFTVTVFSTVGFGDITAKTETARLVTGQMIADLIILGLAIKIIVGAVKRGQQRQTTPGQHPGPARPTTSRADETR